MKSYFLVKKGNWYKWYLFFNTLLFFIACLMLAFVLYKGW